MHTLVQPIFESLALFAWCILATAVAGAETPNELKSLTAEEARGLVAQFQNQKLVLDGLTNLSDDVAAELANHKGRLSLNGLTKVSTHSLELLAMREAGRSPTGLPLVGLELSGLETLPDEGAAALSDYKYSVSLNGLTTVSDKSAAALARVGGLLSLDGLTALSDVAAEHLSRHEAGLSLGGLTTLSDRAASSFANHQGSLYLPGLASLTDAQAMSLAKHTLGALHMPGLKEISPAGAAALSTNNGANIPILQRTAADPDQATIVKADQAGGAAKAKTLGMAGSTEKELAEVYGPIVLRKPGAAGEVLAFLHKGVLVGATMEEGKCTEVAFMPMGRDGKGLVLTKDMRETLQKKLPEWTGINDWVLVPDKILAIGDVQAILMWTSQSYGGYAVIEPWRAGAIIVRPGSDK